MHSIHECLGSQLRNVTGHWLMVSVNCRISSKQRTKNLATSLYWLFILIGSYKNPSLLWLMTYSWPLYTQSRFFLPPKHDPKKHPFSPTGDPDGREVRRDWGRLYDPSRRAWEVTGLGTKRVRFWRGLTQPMDPEKKVWTLFSLLNIRHPQKFKV